MNEEVKRVQGLGPGDPEIVSIIIPTYRRAAAMKLAVESCLAQTYTNLEVIVVSDGPDPEARAAVANLDARLKYLELPTNRGPAEARNKGVQASRGLWVTFLDDDDTILPEKIEHMFRMVDAERPNRMISCRTIYRREENLDVWPSRPMLEGEDVADYILIRPSLLGRPGVLPIQALMVHRSVLDEVPFTTHKDHEDWAWLLEAWHLAGARVEFCWEPLVVYNIVIDSVSRSRRLNWRDSMEWAMYYRKWISSRALNSFLSTKVALKAKRAGDWRGLREISGTVLRNHPSLLDLMFLAGVAALPHFVLQLMWKRSLKAKRGTARG